jgi:hypothetical protein
MFMILSNTETSKCVLACETSNKHMQDERHSSGFPASKSSGDGTVIRQHLEKFLDWLKKFDAANKPVDTFK